MRRSLTAFEDDRSSQETAVCFDTWSTPLTHTVFHDPAEYRKLFEGLLYLDEERSRPSGTAKIPYGRMHEALGVPWHDLRLMYPDESSALSVPSESNLDLTYGQHLSPSQYAAVHSIISHPVGSIPLIISSPPQTGGTAVVVAATFELTSKSPSKVLICTHDDRTADSINNSLLHAGCTPFRLVDSLHEPPIKIDLEPYSVVISTCITASILFEMGLGRGHFTHILIDDAQDVCEPEAMIPIKCLAGDETRVVLVGDVHYGRPLTLSEKTMQLGQSYFHRLTELPIYHNCRKGNFYSIYLTENFTAHPALLDIVNYTFYDGKLRACGNEERIRAFQMWKGLHTPGFPIVVHNVTGLAEEVYELDFSISNVNKEEVQIVVQQLEALLEDGVEGQSIGIISPERAQCRAIADAIHQSRLNARYGKHLVDVKVGRWSDFLHETRPVILISTVLREYSSNLTSRTCMNELHIFNVMMTRAQGLLIIAGDCTALRWLSPWAAFLSYVKAHGGLHEVH